MNEATKGFVKQWLLKAEEDLLVVRKLTEPVVVAASSACFHCQQAVEKSLKAFLIANDIDLKKTHNLEYLLYKCAEVDPDLAGLELNELSDFGVDARYPGDMYTPTDIETLEYKKLAMDIKDLIQRKLFPEPW